MLPNHSSCCLGSEGTARQGRRGSAHLSDTATFANPQTAPTANLTNGNLPTGAGTLREQRKRDMLAAIAEWLELRRRGVSGPERTYWRRLALYEIRQFRFLYLEPERAAFERAVLRSKQHHTEETTS
jgi:hypothetical protein